MTASSKTPIRGPSRAGARILKHAPPPDTASMSNRRTTLGIIQPDSYGNYGYNQRAVASQDDRQKPNNARNAMGPAPSQQNRISMAPQRQSMAPGRTSMPTANPPSGGRAPIVGIVDGMAGLAMNQLSGAARTSNQTARFVPVNNN